MARRTKKSYHIRECKLAECYRCGRTGIPCSVYVADTPEQETGYVDSFSICTTCDDSGTAILNKLCEFLESDDDCQDDWHREKGPLADRVKCPSCGHSSVGGQKQERVG